MDPIIQLYSLYMLKSEKFVKCNYLVNTPKMETRTRRQSMTPPPPPPRMRNFYSQTGLSMARVLVYGGL